jgi:heat shock protein HtpX
MRYFLWLLISLVLVSLFGQLCVYAVYLLEIPFNWALLINLGLLLFAIVCLLLLRPICRSLLKQVKLPDWMQVIVTHLSHRLNILQPELYALSTEGINAFALGDAGRSGVIFFHMQMLAHLTQDEVEAVIAHEIVHLASGHARLMTLLQGMTAPIIVPLSGSFALFISLLSGIRNLRQYFIQMYHLSTVLLFPITTVLIALVMRQWEYDADAQAARQVGKAKYIAALQCLHGSFFQSPDLLNLSTKQHGANRDQWALSHPSLKQRIHALRQVG